MTDYNEKKSSSATGWIIGGIAILAIGAAAIYLTDIDLTQTAELPEVEVQGGQMPEVDMDVADVEVGSEEVTVEVPTIDVEPPVEENETDDLADDLEVDVEADFDADVELENEPQ